MAYAYRNLKNPKNTLSGVADYVLIAPVEDFEDNGIKCPEAPFTNPGDEITIRTPHVFKAGKGFAKWLLPPQKNDLNAASIGDRGFTKLDITLNVMLAGSYASQHEAVKNIMNVPLIVLIKDSNCDANIWYQLGCDCTYAWASPSFATGTTADGNKGWTIPINYQNGYIQLYDADVNALLLADSGSLS